MEDRKEPMDVAFLVKKETVYTKRDIVNHIRQQTPEGQLFVFDLVKLSLDLVIRGKEKLADFDTKLLES